MQLIEKIQLHYGGYSYKLFGSKYLTIYISNYKENSVINSVRYSLQIYSKFGINYIYQVR